MRLLRRNVRTPSFLVRFFPLEREALDEDAFSVALETRDVSGGTLRSLLRNFFTFLTERCGQVERKQYLDAVKRIQTGVHFGTEAVPYSDDELQWEGAELLVPNV